MSSDVFPIRPLRLLRLEIRLEPDLILARQRTRQIAAALGFEPTAQTRVTTALSEIVRNAFHYGGGGAVELAVATERIQGVTRQHLLLTVADRGPGIPRAVLDGRGASTGGGLGLGIIGARRLMDHLDIQSAPGGTTVIMRKALPTSTPLLTPAQLQRLVDRLSAEPAASPVEELQIQNSELLRTLDELRTRESELRARESELTRVNAELTETNTGVLALYDELDTLHRVGMMLAERHNLHDLLQTIIDVTTELTDAEVGAFYYHESSADLWRLHATAGTKRGVLADIAKELPAGFFGQEDNARMMSRIADASQPEECGACARWIERVGEKHLVRSCLFVPVLMANTELAGALIFGHGEVDAFTERCERIVSAVAVQAAVGIEKARLFQGLQSVSEAKDRFLAMLSHELRTPLNPVSMTLSSLSEDPSLPDHLRDDVEMMRRNIELEARLIDDLLDFNRIIRGKLELHHAPVDVDALIHGVVEICQPDITGGKHPLHLELNAGTTVVSGDAARLQQVLWNLLKNAIKFTPRGGEITIRTSLEDRDALLRVDVIDSGCGIPTEELPVIFSAFEQGSLQPGRMGGLGLGLAIAKTFVELHGGSISATSAGEGQGAQFTLRLPVSTGSPSRTPVNAVDPALETGTRESYRILLVDDHADTLRTLTRLLTRRGHAVTAALNCAEALSFARSQSFDILISDIGLPDRSGLELVTDLHLLQNIPAIALSGYGMEEDLASAMAAGFERQLTKPVNFQLLEEAIESLCAGGSRPPRK